MFKIKLFVYSVTCDVTSRNSLLASGTDQVIPRVSYRVYIKSCNNNFNTLYIISLNNYTH